MPIMRNPFRKQDENARPATGGAEREADGSTTKAIDIKEKQPVEYKLSEINDSGVFVPPSPPERKSFWTTSSSRSTTSSHTNPRSTFDENEPFNISRESFDSYRRSFDISARSPVISAAEPRPRASLDSRTFLPPPPLASRTSGGFQRPLQVPKTQQEEAGELEDVSLDDPKPVPKKRGIMSRIMDSDGHHSHGERPASNDGGSKGSSWHHFGGRKRGQSGQGAELGSIPKKEDAGAKPAGSQLKREEVAKQEAATPEVLLSKPADSRPPQEAQSTEQVIAGAERKNSQAPVATTNGVS